MEFTTIPGTKIKLSRIGFGCARISGGAGLRSTSKLIETALECGIRHFDTAPMYGSEGLLGEILQGQNDVTFTTKVGIQFSENKTFKQRFLAPVYRATLRPMLSYSPNIKRRILGLSSKLGAKDRNTLKLPKKKLTRDYVLREIDQSLVKLKRDFIDIYLIHEPQQFEITEETLEIFDSLKRDGTIRAFGLGGNQIEIEDPIFGSVDQLQFDADVTKLDYRNTFKIYHGILRHRNIGELMVKDFDPYALFQEVLGVNLNSAIIFSASSSSAIRKVVIGRN